MLQHREKIRKKISICSNRDIFLTPIGLGMQDQSQSRRTFSASEIGNYVVCPEAWRLKYVVRGSFKKVDETHEGFQLRQTWAQSADLAAQLKRYARVVFMLLVILVLVVFIIDQYRWLKTRALEDASEIKSAAGHEPVLTGDTGVRP